MQAKAHNAHKAKMAAKAARNKDPAARAAKLAEINGPILQRRRLTTLKSLAMEIAANSGKAPAECMKAAVDVLVQKEHGIANQAAAKASRAGRTYPSDGNLAHFNRHQKTPEDVSYSIEEAA